VLKLLVPFLLILGLVGLTVFEDRPLPRADLVYSNHADVTTLDLSIMSWLQDFRVARMMYEGLTRKDIFSWDYHAVPGVAESWEISQDGKTYTFHLRENARWSNGEPVKASDFVYAWRRVILPDNAGDYSKLFQMIRGVTEFQDWRTSAMADFAKRTDIKDRRTEAESLWERTLAKFDELVGVKALDDRTLRVELVRPTPYFLDLTSFGSLFPCYEPLVRAFESVDPETGRMRTSPEWTKPPRCVSNGAFKLTRWRFERDMRFEKNSYYWDRNSIALDSIEVPSIQDTNAQVMAFRTGALDFLSDVSAGYRADMLEQKQEFYKEHWDEYQALKAQGLDPVEIDRRLPRDPRKNIHAFPSFGTYFYNFNCRETLPDGRVNPFHDARVRRAFAMAVDKEAIVKSVRRGGEPVADALIPPGSIAGYHSPRGVSFDPEGARRLLAEAGYPEGKGFITVDILFNKDAGHDLIAQSVAKNWSEYLGVEVTLSMKEINVVRDDLKNGNFIVSRGSWYGDYGDPTTFLDLSRTGDGNNDRKYSNPEYDGLLDQAKEEADPSARMRILERAEALLMDQELPVLPIFHYVEVYLFDANRITGISSHPRLEQMMQWVDVFGDGKGTDLPRVMKN
jgi:oligopeptide transport system substrate-binding protein